MGTFFFNSRGRLRAGWRLLLFLALLSFLGALFNALLIPFLPELDGLTPEGPSPSSPQEWHLILLLDGYLLIPLLLASWVMVRYVDRRPFASLGLSLRACLGRELLWGAALGGAMSGLYLVGGWLIGALQLKISSPSGELLGKLGLLLFGFLLAAAFEETLFHGYALQTLLEGIGVYPALFLISVVFSLSHRANPHIALIGLINIALASLLLALGYLKTRALWLPIGVHFSWNAFQALCGLPVSGLDFGPGLIQLELSGPEVLTGGAFGPEGGLLATAVFILALAFVVLSRRIKPSEPMAELWEEHIHPAFSRGLEL